MKRIDIVNHEGCYVEYSGDVMAIFSPQVVKIVYDVDCDMQLTIGRVGGEYVTETRSPIEKGDFFVTEFEVSRMLQIAGRDVTDVLDSIKYGNGAEQSIYDEFVLYVYEMEDGDELIDRERIQGFYGACDAWETLFKDGSRRLFVNFPQTIPVGWSVDGEEGEVEFLHVDGTGTRRTDSQYFSEGKWPCVREVDLYNRLPEFTIFGNLGRRDMKNIYGMNIQQTLRIEDGEDKTDSMQSEFYGYNVKADTTPFGKGVYLRWLHRDGTVGYWLFTKSKGSFSASANNSYREHLQNYGAYPVNGIYQNPQRTDYDVNEQITVGCANVNNYEYDFLCGLVSSPCVEMLIGGDRDNPKWLQVNIVAGTYGREYARSGLDRLADFECVITLPQKSSLRR